MPLASRGRQRRERADLWVGADLRPPFWLMLVHVSQQHGSCGLNEAVKDPGSRLENISLFLAAVPCSARKESRAKCHHSRQHTFHHLAGLVGQDLAWNLEACRKRHESLGTQRMVLFNLVVHLHPGWTGWGTQAIRFLPFQPAVISPTSPSLPHRVCPRVA